jgi:hypothetical protein
VTGLTARDFAIYDAGIAQTPSAGGDGAGSGRKALSILMLLTGAAVGTVWLLNGGFTPPLALGAPLAGAVSDIGGSRGERGVVRYAVSTNIGTIT